MPRLTPGVVVITGASSGIGRCTAMLFAGRGWRVGLIARGAAGLASASEEIARSGGHAVTAAADVADSAALEAAAAAIERRLGRIDVWINCAGNGVYGRFVDVTAAEFRRVTDVTYLGAVNGMRVALAHMRRDGGRIVNVCSAIAYRGLPLLTSYSGAKSGLRHVTDALRRELRREASRVRLTTVYPPAVNTPFFSHAASYLARPPRPAAPVYQPEVVAEGIYLAATGRRREVRIGSVTVLFALGNRLAPGLMSFLVGRLGYAGQMTTLPEAARLRDPTIFAPSARASGARGPFNDEARGYSVQLWLSRHRGTAAALGAACALLLAHGRRRRRTRRPEAPSLP